MLLTSAAETAITLNWGTVVIGIVVIICLSELIISAANKIFNVIKKKVLGDKAKDDNDELIKNLTSRQLDLEKELKGLSKVVKEMNTTFTSSLKDISQQIEDMEAKSDESSKAKLKDRIAQAYRHYHETKEWTKMDKEAFLGLIKDYERHGGQNSFVHSVCEPELYTWKVVDEDEQ